MEHADTPQVVSLVATVLNEAASVHWLLASIDEQSRPPDEVVIVDGGSSDGTWQTLERWAEEAPNRVALREPGANISRGRNLAIERARGGVIAVTDAGVRLEPRWLERLVGALEAEPEAGVASGFFVPDCHGVWEIALRRDDATGRPRCGPRAVSAVEPLRRVPQARLGSGRRVPGVAGLLRGRVFDLALRKQAVRFAWVPDAIVFFRPRPTPGAFFRQYYLYARGDGRPAVAQPPCRPLRHV
jgi:glycosyltransferase involved in cell wall biosynthesis